jgi:hypothetical protein
MAGGTIMSEELKFLGYVVEIYKTAKGMNGKQAFQVLQSTGALDYVLASASALHTTGAEYTIQQIDDYIATHHRV